jgi:hypothetical protein
MRPLAASEKTLFLILCGALFVALNLLGIRAFFQVRTGIQKAITATKLEIAADRTWMELGESINPAVAWLDSHPMPQMEADAASAELLKTERDEAEKSGLKVIEENLLPSQTSPQGSGVAVAVKLSGSFASLVKMLFALQTPTAWRTIDKISIRSDAQPPSVIAELEVCQHFNAVDSAGKPVPSP